MFIIEKKSPSSNWNKIHSNFNREDAEFFLEQMSEGGFDESGTDGSFNKENMTAHFYEGGDRMEFRAIEITGAI